MSAGIRAGAWFCAIASLSVGAAETSSSSATPSPAPAASPVTPPPLPARGPGSALALEAAQTALDACLTNGYKVSVSVVDSAGVVRVLLASDGARDRAVDSGTRKAFTAVAFRASTAAVAQQAAADPTVAARIAADPKLWARAGGLPILVGDELIGAIGVGGAPGGEKDEACAVAAIDRIKDRLK